MLSLVLWFLLPAGIVLMAALWRRERQRAQARDAVLRAALQALALQHYEEARNLAATITRNGTAPAGAVHNETTTLAQALAATAEALQHASLQEQIAHRELEDVLSSLQDAVLVVDGEARLRFINSAAVALFEVRVQDVLGAQLLEALPSFGLEASIRAALAEGLSTARDINLYSPAVREVFLRVAPVRHAGGGVTGAVAIIQDFTEIRRLERVRRDFVANASHELRTPIANIRATAETILDSPEDPALVARFLPHLVLEAERLSRLVSDLLDLAKADSGSSSGDATFDLSQVAAEVVARLAAKAAQNGIEVLCQCPGPVRVCGDPLAIEQVVFNLLDNALIYTPRGSQVQVRARASAAGAQAELVVADNGAGIPEADLARVFERFYRVDKARSRAQGGTGLGLAIVKHIVENHGGHVRVESEAGVGTTFTVALPAA